MSFPVNKPDFALVEVPPTSDHLTPSIILGSNRVKPNLCLSWYNRRGVILSDDYHINTNICILINVVLQLTMHMTPSQLRHDKTVTLLNRHIYYQEQYLSFLVMALPHDDTCICDDLVLHRLVLKTIRRPLWDAKTSQIFTMGSVTALKGHQALWIEKGILHRDMSPGNIFISLLGCTESCEGFIADLELAWIAQAKTKKIDLLEPVTSSGTTLFMAGELLDNSRYVFQFKYPSSPALADGLALYDDPDLYLGPEDTLISSDDAPVIPDFPMAETPERQSPEPELNNEALRAMVQEFMPIGSYDQAENRLGDYEQRHGNLPAPTVAQIPEADRPFRVAWAETCDKLRKADADLRRMQRVFCAWYSGLGSRGSVVGAWYSGLGTRGSVLGVRYSGLGTR
ncbi:hypothetical protein C8R48DRAFT_674006 [Suillus tomentosus]|nr:hypothetical protein C8R48DRAFT_674006 [Suillus tomentosus]